MPWPSYIDGCYPLTGRPRYPELWDGCVGAWAPCLGPTGATLHDMSPYHRDGTLTNMDVSSDWVLSSGRYALDFDGSNDYVVAPVALVGKSSLMTLSCHVYLGSTAVRGAFIKIGSGGANGIGLGVGSTNFETTGNRLILLFENVRWIDTATAIGTGWHHVAVSLNSSSNPTCYIDGASVYSDTGTAMAAITNANPSGVYIGGYTVANRFVTGAIDDVRVYERQLSANNIRMLARRRGIAYETEEPAAYTAAQIAAFKAAWAHRQRMLIGGGVL